MRITFCRLFFCLGLLIAPCETSQSQELPTQSTAQQSDPKDVREKDLAAIRAGAKSFADAFQQQDAQALASLWTEQGEYTDDTGQTFIGRDAIRQSYGEFFDDNPEATIRIVIDSLRLVSQDAAIEKGRAILDPTSAGAPGVSKYTVMHVKVDGKWLMASVQDSWVESPSTHRNIADLQWLIGTWVAEDGGIKTESTCRWVGNKSFVERRYTVFQADGTQTTGLQLIGWNPLIGQVQSWNFSPEGGHAVGQWTPHEGGWTAEMNGVTGEGVTTSSVNLLTRLDDQAYVWQSIRRTADGIPLPDTNEIVLRRQALEH